MAKEHSIDLDTVEGTGSRGRVLIQDVLDAAMSSDDQIAAASIPEIPPDETDSHKTRTTSLRSMIKLKRLRIAKLCTLTTTPPRPPREQSLGQ